MELARLRSLTNKAKMYGLKNLTYGRHWTSWPLQIIAPIQVCISNESSSFLQAFNFFYFDQNLFFLSKKILAREVAWFCILYIFFFIYLYKFCTFCIYGHTIFLAGTFILVWRRCMIFKGGKFTDFFVVVRT